MRDFTTEAYKEYLYAIKSKYKYIMRFDEYLSADPKPSNFCLIRHDVDRAVSHAVTMAELEFSLGVRASYYFRAKRSSFNVSEILRISELGHEIGYHYESLSDSGGNFDKALTDFERNLERFRNIVKIKTISMHGRFVSSFDNRDLWRSKEYHKLLYTRFRILGEIYVDIDYSDILYVHDNGRNWNSTKYNRRDTTNSELDIDFNSGNELLRYLENSPYSKMVFQIHPEMWASNGAQYWKIYFRETAKNFVKGLFLTIFK